MATVDGHDPPADVFAGTEYVVEHGKLVPVVIPKA